MQYTPHGLMALSQHFEQQQINLRRSGYGGFVPLRTPSGAQTTTSWLVMELIEQLAFVTTLYDVLTRPVVHYTVNGDQRTYVPDLAIQLYEGSAGPDAPMRYLIDVRSRTRHGAAGGIATADAARRAAAAMGGAYRVLDETVIRTPYLVNTRMLRRHLDDDPELKATDILHHQTGGARLTVVDAITVLERHGMTEPDARQGIEQGVAWRIIRCDLRRKFDDMTTIRTVEPGVGPDVDDPFIRTIYKAPQA